MADGKPRQKSYGSEMMGLLQRALENIPWFEISIAFSYPGKERDGEVVSCPGNDITTWSQKEDGNFLKLSILQGKFSVRNASGENRPAGSTFPNPVGVMKHFLRTFFGLPL